MPEDVPSIERIIAKTIYEKAFGDPDKLAADIIADLGKNGLWIVPEDAGPADQSFDELKPEMRPQDPHGDGRDWKFEGWTFETCEHGGDEPDNMPQAIKATDAQGHWAVYVPLTRGGRIVIPRPAPEDGTETLERGADQWGNRPTPDELRAQVFEDRETPGNWRVEKMDEDGGYEVVKVFTGPHARRNAIRYAKQRFAEYDEIWLEPYFT
jgi:hypothetical protein